MPLHVARTPPNPWDLFDRHGTVEEWCLDWYGPYEAGDQTDPVGRADGDFRVTRGGSHSTELYYLRSSNRSGTVPDDKSWLIGFRLVLAPILGRSWTYRPSPFPPISSGQRLVLLRLNEGPIFFASFARAIAVENAAGERMTVSGLFAALSFDEGRSWKICKAIATERECPTETFDGRRIVLGPTRGEPRGHLSVCQTPQGIIHLISSRLHYEFNLKWLLTPPPRAEVAMN